METKKKTTFKISKEPSDKDNKFLLEQYHVLSNARVNHNELFWNVPMTFLTAQSFLLVIALGGFESPPWGRAIGAFISAVFGILSIQIFERNRINEISDSELLLDIERHFTLQGYSGTLLHQKASDRSYLNGQKVEHALESKNQLKFLSKGVSYDLWKKGMWLVTFLSLLLFLYNVLHYYNNSFLGFDSFKLFVQSIDRTAAGVILILFALNWLIYLFDLINPLKGDDKNKVDLSKKITRNLEIFSLGLAIVYSYLVYKNLLNSKELPYMWPLLYIICTILLTIYLSYTTYLAKIKQEQTKKKNTSLILAGGQNIRLASSRIGIVKFIDVLNKDHKTLLEDTLNRNDSVTFEQVILTIEKYSRNIHAVNSIQKKLPTVEFLTESAVNSQVINPTFFSNNDSTIPQEERSSSSDATMKSNDKNKKSEEVVEYHYKSDIRLIFEPDSKGTATAIFYYLWDWKHKNAIHHSESDTVLIITPTDHVIPEMKEYSNAIRKVCALAEEFNSIYLLGIVPNYPSTQYGYLRVNNTYSSILKVEMFIEKPEYDEALSLIREGFALWNSGIFIARHSVLFNAFCKHWKHFKKFPTDFTSKPDFAEIYRTIRKVSSFDIDVLQKVDNLFAARISFDWVDVGDPQRLQAAVNDKICYLS